MNLLDQTKAAFAQFRSSVVQAMQYLYQVRESGDWMQVSPTWTDYVKNELEISQGFASKLLSVNKHYLIEGGLSPENIQGIDYERLYIAQQTAGTPEEHVAKAKTLSRRELREEKVDDGHIHGEEIVRIYKCCGMRVPDDA
jgi:hypothetical protein